MNLRGINEMMEWKGPNSKCGHQLTTTSHFQSHVLLTHLLWPRLKSAGEQKEKGKAPRAARIVNVSSCAHWAGFCVDFDDLNCR